MSTVSRHNARRGSVLILVLWIVIVLGLIGLAYSASVRTQLMTSRAGRGRHVAQWAARSGVERAMAELSQADLKSLADASPLLDDEENFKAQPVGDTSSFSLIALPDDEGNPRYGLVDECARISINQASEAMLTNLTGVTKEMAESLIDWRDSDSNPLTEGGENDYYQSLTPPYLAKNAPFDSIRELVRVKGWGPMFDQASPDPYKRFSPVPTDASAPTQTETAASTGDLNNPAPQETPDPNANPSGGMSTDASGNSTDASQSNNGISTGDEMLPEDARKLLNGLTAWSASPVANPDGTDKANLNQADANELMSVIPGLSQDEANAIVSYRQNRQFRTPADLLSVTAQQNNGGGTPQLDNSGNAVQSGQTVFTLSRVGEIIDYCTTQQTGTRGGVTAKTQAGKININTASRDVLLTLPGVTEELADEILNEREGNGAFTKPGDLANVNGITNAQFTQIYPLVCTQSSRFHVTSQGVDSDSGAVATVEAVLDIDDQQKVTVVYWREF